MKNALFNSAISLICLIALCLAANASAQDDTAAVYAPKDTVFYKISLGDDGIVAVDTFGYEWFYDFTGNTFVYLSPDGQRDMEPESDIDMSTVAYVAVEERCTQERKVNPGVRSISVGYDEYVAGDIIAYGRVTVKGWVKGDIRSVNKRVLVTNSGRVDGSIEAPEIVVKEGGVVLGRQIILGTPDLEGLKETFSIDGVILVTVFTGVILFIGFLTITLMPRQYGRFSYCFGRYKSKSYIIGFLALLTMPVVLLLVLITIVGVVVVPFIPILYLLAILLGAVGFGDLIGHFVATKFLGGEKSRMFQTLLGVLVFMGIWMLTAVLLGSTDTTANGFGIALLVLIIVLSSYPLFSGLGAAVLTRFGFRDYVSWREQQEQAGVSSAPAPPPIPEAPAIPIPRDLDSDETSDLPPRKPI